jgi:SAM-dependent methyltransferase
VTEGDNRWNHNIHYHPLILSAIPPGCSSALDIGCGEGILARELSQLIPKVTGIDLDEPSLQLAREQDAGREISFVVGEFLTYPFEGTFGFITSVAALHHMDMRQALTRMARLLSPGGTLAVIGLARSRIPADLPADLAGAALHRVHLASRDYWQHSAPMVWPPETYRSAKRVAPSVRPGVRYRRRLLWRYSLVWSKPS